mgnify:CR=1 FL=1
MWFIEIECLRIKFINKYLSKYIDKILNTNHTFDPIITHIDNVEIDSIIDKFIIELKEPQKDSM